MIVSIVCLSDLLVVGSFDLLAREQESRDTIIYGLSLSRNLFNRDLNVLFTRELNHNVDIYLHFDKMIILLGLYKAAGKTVLSGAGLWP